MIKITTVIKKTEISKSSLFFRKSNFKLTIKNQKSQLIRTNGAD